MLNCSLTIPNLMQLFTILTLYHTILTFNDPEEEDFENIVEKGENAGNQHFLLFPQCFLPFLPKKFNFSATFILLSANLMLSI